MQRLVPHPLLHVNSAPEWFERMPVSIEMTLKDFCEKSGLDFSKKCDSMFVELCCVQDQEVRDVVLMDKVGPHMLN